MHSLLNKNAIFAECGKMWQRSPRGLSTSPPGLAIRSPSLKHYLWRVEKATAFACWHWRQPCCFSVSGRCNFCSPFAILCARASARGFARSMSAHTNTGGGRRLTSVRWYHQERQNRIASPSSRNVIDDDANWSQ